jgi:hypothetical protein
MRTQHEAFFLLLTLMTACSKTAPAHTADPATGTTHANAATQAQDTGDLASAGGLSWRAPRPLISRPPKSPMRAAEYGVEGDDASELVVSYFGADQGGPIEANITRWITQFSAPDGSAIQPQRSERTVRGNRISLVEVRGTYSGGMAMPGAPPKAAQTNAVLLGAIVTGPSGTVFFKLVGPRAGVDLARPAFDALLESLSKVP